MTKNEAKARKLYKGWFNDTREPKKIKINIPDISKDTLLCLGEIENVVYKSDKERKGKFENWIHTFGKKEPALLLSNSDGSLMLILGPKTKVKPEGITG